MYWNFRSLLVDFLISIPLLIVTFTFICVGSSALTADVYLVSAPETLVIMDTLIAATSGGQVHVNESDFLELTDMTSFSLMQALTTVFYRMSLVTGGLFNFPVDETVSKILVTINGGAGFDLTTPQGRIVRQAECIGTLEAFS